MTDEERQQRKIRTQYAAEYVPSPAQLKVGIALNVLNGTLAINGLRKMLHR